jgi:hypothetical protein
MLYQLSYARAGDGIYRPPRAGQQRWTGSVRRVAAHTAATRLWPRFRCQPMVSVYP